MNNKTENNVLSEKERHNACNKKYHKKNKEKILKKKRENYQKNKEKILERNKEYRQRNREQLREKQKDYEREKRSNENYVKCKKEYLKNWQLKNPEKYLHGLRRKKHVFSTLTKYVNANSKKVYKRKNTIHLFIHLKPQTLYSLAKKQKLKCAISGMKLTNENMSVDHIIPLSKGGTNDIKNLRLLHIDINRIMLDYSDDVFLNYCKLIVEESCKMKRDYIK